MAIHFIFSELGRREVKYDQDQFSKVEHLKWVEMPMDEIKSFFPDSEDIKGAFRYLGDYSNKFDMFEMEEKKSKENGVVWKENKNLKNVYLDQDSNGRPFACGVEFDDG